MNPLLDAALGYCHLGWNVFPIHSVVNGICSCGRADCSSPGKHPRTPHGLKDASSEMHVIEEWWRRWPTANIGLATGTTSGIVVVDVDFPAALASLGSVIDKLPRTLTALTGGGGVHLFFRPSSVGPRSSAATSLGGRQSQEIEQRGLRCTTGRLPGIEEPLPGIDLRADGGYVVAPPSTHRSGERYTWLDLDTPIAQAPEWLRNRPFRRRVIVPSEPRFTTGTGTPYGLAALEGELTRLRSAKVGERNHTLYRVARRLSELAAEGHLDQTAVTTELHTAALTTGLSDHEIHRTLNSALGQDAL